jgi:hypothetical protein
VGGIAPLGLIVIIAACSAPESSTAPGDASGQEASAQSGVIDVASNSQISLSLRGGLGPIVEGRTVTKAIVTVSDVELVSESGRSLVVSSEARRVDLLAFQNDLDQLVASRSIEVDRYREIRFRLRSAWIETTDDQQVTRVFASEEADRSEFSAVQSVGRLEIQGITLDGFVSCALPDTGIRVQGTASLAIHFALAESLTMQSADVWVLNPRAWCVDASSFSSLDLEFQLTEETYTELSQGYSVMLLDAGLRPVCRANLTRFSSASLTASFRFLESFQGPFVAVLLPPSGIVLDSSVAVSVDVSASVRVETNVSVTSVQRLGRTGNVTTVAVRTASNADVIEHDATGVVTGRHQRPIGCIENVAPQSGPREPLRPGEHAPPPSAAPTLPGLPPPPPPPPGGRPGPQIGSGGTPDAGVPR